MRPAKAGDRTEDADLQGKHDADHQEHLAEERRAGFAAARRLQAAWRARDARFAVAHRRAIFSVAGIARDAMDAGRADGIRGAPAASVRAPWLWLSRTAAWLSRVRERWALAARPAGIGGTVDLVSTLGEGSTFVLTLPADIRHKDIPA